MKRDDEDPRPDAAVWIDDLSELSAVRNVVAEIVPDGDDIRLDAAVVISELVTNAFEHGHAPIVGVEMRRANGRLHGVVISATDDQPGEFEPDPRPPAADHPRGRGLVIVRSLTDAYRVRIADGHRRDSVEFDIGGRSSN